MIAIDSSKEHALHVDPETQINFTGNLKQRESATIFFIIEEAKVTTLIIL